MDRAMKDIGRPIRQLQAPRRRRGSRETPSLLSCELFRSDLVDPVIVFCW